MIDILCFEQQTVIMQTFAHKQHPRRREGMMYQSGVNHFLSQQTVTCYSAAGRCEGHSYDK